MNISAANNAQETGEETNQVLLAPGEPALSTSDNEKESAPTFTNEREQEPELDGVVDIEFLDLTLQPIVDLKYRFEIEGQRISGKTDAKGRTQRLLDIQVGTLVDVYVFREHLKDYKKVGTICGTGGECGFSVVSPKVRFALDTEPHEGEPGNAEENNPPIPPVLGNDAQVANSAGAPTGGEVAKPVGAAIAASAVTTVATSATVPEGLPPSKPPVSGTSTQAKQEPKTEKGRDSKGNPQVTILPAAVDSFFKAVLPMYHLWTWARDRSASAQPAKQNPTNKSKDATKDSKASAQTTNSASTSSKDKSKTASPAGAQTKPGANTTTAPHQAINPAANLSQAKGAPLSAKNKEHLDALVNYAEAQVLIDYKEYKGGKVTEKILNAVNSHPPVLSPAKSAVKPGGMCFAYVRVALFQSRFINLTAGQGQAVHAGLDLVKDKYSDVTASLPQATIFYPGGFSNKQQEKVAAIEAERKGIEARAIKEKWKSARTKEAIAKLEAPPKPEGGELTQPDLMYTLPGDIIVYKQVVPYLYNADGHIDIRTYHGFVSDFVWRLLPKLGGVKSGGKQYAVIGVYRKVSDEMAMVRVKAFLKIVREYETNGFSEADVYFALPDVKNPTTRKPLKRMFTSTNTHPFSVDSPVQYETSDYYDNENTSAGAYQIKLGTWKDVIRDMGWPKKFDIDMQTRIAIHRLQYRNDKGRPLHKTALGYLMQGDIERAVSETNLSDEWSWLPGGKEKNVKISMPELKAKFSAYVEAMIK